MSDPFVGEIRMVGFNFAPKGWAQCNGQIMPISQNTALFALLGTYYGGDGKITFALPNLMGSAPLAYHHDPYDNSTGLTPRYLGEMGGAAGITLLEAEIPFHGHGDGLAASSPGRLQSPQGSTWGPTGGRTSAPAYADAAPNVSMYPNALSITGGSLPHNNMQPYLVVNFIIAMQGVFPMRP